MDGELEERQAAIRQVESEMKNASTLLEQMKVQASQMNASEKKAARSRTKSLGRQLKGCKKQLASIKRELQDEELRAGGGGGSEFHQEAQNERMRRGVDTLRNAYGELNNAEEDAEAGIEELTRQDEILRGARTKAQQTSMGIFDSTRLVDRMQNRIFRHRFYIALMIAGSITLQLFVLIVCLSGESSDDDG
eukprot:g3699.t1